MSTASPRFLKGPLPLSHDLIPEVARPFYFPAGKKSIPEQSAPYVPAAVTDVAETWKRFGFDAQANAERRAQLKMTSEVRHLAEAAQFRELLTRTAAARQVA